MEIKQIPIELLQLNTGQIAGVPTNPRIIKDNRYAALKQSIEDDPEMLDVREIVVIPGAEPRTYVVIAGNMRTTACKELGWETVPCKVLPITTPAKKLRAIATKDNVNFGSWDWDAVANEWDVDEMGEWGVEAYTWEQSDFDGLFEAREEQGSKRGTTKIVFEFEDKVHAKVTKALTKHGKTPEQALLKLLGL